MRLNLLGPAELLRADGPVPIGSPKERALLTLLALHADRVLPVDTLADRLWGEDQPRAPKSGIQVYVSHLRRVLEPTSGPPQVLVSSYTGYALMTEQLDLDLREAEQLVSTGRQLAGEDRPAEALAAYDAALALWRGEVLVDVRDHEWARASAERLEDLRRCAVEERAAMQLQLGRQAEAVPALEELVEQDPLRERAWELLARGYHASARQADALGAVRRATQVLADELGLDPGPALRELEAAILRQELVPPAPQPVSRPASFAPAAPVAAHVPPPAARAQHRLVGREDELATLLDLVTGATTGADPSALVLGDPGVGKSALVEELAARAGLPVLRGRSPDHGAVPPLWPWEQVLRDLASLRPDVEAPAEVRALIEGTLVTPEAGESDGARLRFYDAVVGHLAAAGPLLVVLEDLHAADAPTLRLLEHAVAARVPGLAVVGTARSHEASAMSSTMSRLAHLGTRRVELGGLGVDDVRRLLADLGDGATGAPDADDVLARTGGNPFLVTQVALSGTEVPQAVRDVVAHRVASLGEQATAVLEAAAVVGDEAQAWVVAEVAGVPMVEAVEVLDAAERAGLVRASGSGAGALTVRFAHSLLVDALLARRSSAWQALAHERCAVALTRVFGDRDDRHAAIARHWVAAAELGPAQAAAAAEFCARAARAAMNRRAAEAAVPLWQEAVAADAVAGGDPGTSFDLLLGLAGAAHAAGLLGDAQEVVTRALALAEERHDAEQVVRALDAFAGHGVWIPFQDAEEAQRLVDRLENALDRLPPDSPAQVLGRGVRMMLWGAIGDEEAIAADLRDLHAESHTLDPDLSRRVAYHAVVACRGPGLVEERGLAAQWLRGLVREHTALGVVADLQATTYAAEQGDLEHARGVVADLERRTADLRDPTLARQVLSARIGLMINDGCYDEAWHCLDEAAATPTPLAEFFTIDEWGQRTHLRWEQGRLHELADAIDYGFHVLGVAGFAYARGLAHLEVGEPDRAREMLSVPLPRRDFTRASASVARAALAVALGDREVLEDSRRVLTPYAGRLVVTGQLSGVYGAYDGILGEVCLALGDLDAARRHLTAALELLEPGGNVRWTARARAALEACS